MIINTRFLFIANNSYSKHVHTDSNNPVKNIHSEEEILNASPALREELRYDYMQHMEKHKPVNVIEHSQEYYWTADYLNHPTTEISSFDEAFPDYYKKHFTEKESVSVSESLPSSGESTSQPSSEEATTCFEVIKKFKEILDDCITRNDPCLDRIKNSNILTKLVNEVQNKVKNEVKNDNDNDDTLKEIIKKKLYNEAEQ